MRKVVFAALGALGETGNFELPNVAASLVSSRLRHFSLRYCHLYDLLQIKVKKRDAEHENITKLFRVLTYEVIILLIFGFVKIFLQNGQARINIFFRTGTFFAI